MGVPLARQRLLVVDPDERSRRLLEVSLRKAGYRVVACADAEAAFDAFVAEPADLVITETHLGAADGLALMARLRERPEGRHVPVVLLSSDASVESKVRGLQSGAADYLTKPIYVRELLTRVEVELQRRLGSGSSGGGARFQGSLAEMGLVDLLQTIELSGKRGVLRLHRGEERAVIWFDAGRPVHAESGVRRGSEAVYRALRWNEGSFDLRFDGSRPPKETIDEDPQSLVMEGLRRLDDWQRACEALPSLDAVLLVEPGRLVQRLAEIPDELNTLLRAFDGCRNVEEAIEQAECGELEALQAVARLYEEGILVDSGRRSTVPPPPSVEEVDDALAGALLPAANGVQRASLDASGDAPGPVAGSEGATDRANMAHPVPKPSTQPSKNQEITEGEPAAKGAGTKRASLSHAEDGAPFPERAPKEARMPKRKGKKRRKKSSTATRKHSAGSKAASKKATVIQFPAVAAGAEGAVVDTGAKDEVGAAPAEVPEPEARRASRPERTEPEGRDELESAGSAPQAEAGETVEAEDRAPAKQKKGGKRKKGRKGKERRAQGGPKAEEARKAVSEPPAPVADEEVEEVGATSAEAASASTRPKTTSSQMIAALTATGEHAAVTEEFFQQPTDVPESETWDDLEQSARQVTPHERRARWITMGIVAVGLAVIGGYVVVQKVFMPQPAQVGGPPPAAEVPELPAEALAAPEGEGDLAPVERVPAPPVEEGASAPAAGSPPAAAQHAAEEGTQAGTVEGAEERQGEPAAEAAGVGAPSEQGGEPSAAPGEAPSEQGTEPTAAPTEAPDVVAAAPSAAAGGGDYTSLLAEARKARGTRKKIEAFERALQANPQGVDALEELGFLYLNRGKMAEAMRYAEQAVQIDPTRSKAWITLGAARQARGDRAGAQEAYRSCVERGQGRFVAECRRMVR